MSIVGHDPLRLAVDRALIELAAGKTGDAVENELVDCKEDPSRRRGRELLDPGPTEDEGAATFLAGEAACLANSGGGGLVVGVNDKSGQVLGTNLDAQWLRRRIFELSGSRFATVVEEVRLEDRRLLVVLAYDAIEPVRVGGRLRMRIERQCVEVDASTYAARLLERRGHDDSAQWTDLGRDSVRAGALDVVRSYLRASGEAQAADLAGATDEDLLRRLEVVDDQGRLSSAGALSLTATRTGTLIDYRRRDVPGGDSRIRLEPAGVSLLEAFAQVEQAIAQANPLTHVVGRVASGQIPTVPQRAVREALANAAIHREWLDPDPIVVEFVGPQLTVVSPGGFLEGIGPRNWLSAVPRSRNPRLADLFRRLRVAEREGVGVDRMYREMVRVGHEPPALGEEARPAVRVTLLGGNPNPAMVEVMSNLEPADSLDDVEVALVVHELRTRATVDAQHMADVLQKPEQEAQAALERAAGTTFSRQPLVTRTAASRRYRFPDYHFGEGAMLAFGSELPYRRMTAEEAEALVVAHVARRGRISSSEYAELVGVTPARGSQVLSALARSGVLSPPPGRTAGAGFHYVPGPSFPTDASSRADGPHVP